MKLTLCVFLFLIANVCQAECTFNNEYFPSLPQPIDVASLFKSGGDVILKGTLQCQVDDDYSEGQVLTSSIHIGPSLQAANAGVVATLNGQSPESDGSFNVIVSLGKKYDVEVKIHFSNDAGHAFIIHKGDEIFTFTVNYSESGADGSYQIRNEYKAVSADDGNINTGICHINNDNPLNVDFGNIGISKLGENISDENNSNSKLVTLLYNCDRSDVTQKIILHLVAVRANYSLPEGGLIGTSLNDVGVALLHNGKNIQPGDHFESQINNGQGSDSIKILLIKNPNVNANSISTGAFSASAVLIMDEN
ncbi:TPA: fimbrial protein [Klebsiella aerogenes]|nr:fimbrial protein [Klebsiella aerogenes]